MTNLKTVEEVVQNIQVSSYHEHCWDDVGLIKLITQDRQSHCDELVRLIESEIEILEQVIEKTKEYVAVGHKKVYEAIKIISEYKGKLEGYKDVLTIVKEVYKSNN